MARQGNISPDMATVLKVAGRCRLNILISGGTGSGKTTLLNAMSRMIDHGERTVTIEDAAELQLQQPHVVRLETRPANIEGEGEITMRHLVKNALRMRPDRIILGEIRGEEAIDMLQAMNTGHDGSMGTIHSNTPRDALTRLENMVAMSGFKLPAEAVREQIQSGDPPHHPDQPPARRQAADHPGDRDHRDGGRGRHHPGPLQVHLRGREERRQRRRPVRVQQPAPALHAARRVLRPRHPADGGDGMSFDLIVAFAIFIAAVAVVIGLGLFVITVVLRMQHMHRKRLARVGRRRMSGRLDLDDARLMLVRQKTESNLVVKLTEALAKFIPLLDTARLRANFRRAGLDWSVATFVAISLGLGGCSTVGGYLLSGKPFMVCVVPGLFLGMLLADRFVKFRGDRRANRFMKQLPDAIDTIIRGIRSGLPVIECIGGVGQEFDDPVGGHFQAISERVMLGETLDGALWRVARVIDKPEMDFFAISIAIQVETGGSLSEALGNLADLLRARERMKLKIKAISSEAKASAMIIGALPFMMLALLMMMSPDYIMTLFTDPRGQIMLGCGLTASASAASSCGG